MSKISDLIIEIAELKMKGMPDKKIAAELDIPESYVKSKAVEETIKEWEES